MKDFEICTKEERVYYSGKSDEQFKANKEKAIEKAKAKYIEDEKYFEIEVEDKDEINSDGDGELIYGRSIIKAKYKVYKSSDNSYSESGIENTSRKTIKTLYKIINFAIIIIGIGYVFTALSLWWSASKSHNDLNVGLGFAFFFGGSFISVIMGLINYVVFGAIFDIKTTRENTEQLKQHIMSD